MTGRRYGSEFDVDAAYVKRRFSRLPRGNPSARGWIATYVADEMVLGKRSTGLRELDRQVKRHLVSSSFRSLLLRRLKRWGYR